MAKRKKEEAEEEEEHEDADVGEKVVIQPPASRINDRECD